MGFAGLNFCRVVRAECGEDGRVAAPLEQMVAEDRARRSFIEARHVLSARVSTGTVRAALLGSTPEGRRPHRSL